MLPHTDGDRSTSRKRLLIISLLLVAAGLIAFWQVTGSGFTSYGDTLYLTKNAHVQNSLTLEGIGWASTAGHAANWHPLTWISHMMDVQLFGMRPGWHPSHQSPSPPCQHRPALPSPFPHDKSTLACPSNAHTGAIADLKRAIELNPKHGEAYYNPGVVYLSLGDHKRAADDMRTAARLGQDGARQVLKSLGLGW